MDPQVVGVQLNLGSIRYQGIPARLVSLFDDGTHGDVQPNDHEFTLDELSYDFSDDPMLGQSPLLTITTILAAATVTYLDQRTETVTIDYPVPLRLIRREYYSAPKITRLGDDAQMTEYSLNLVQFAPPPLYEVDTGKVTHRYYGLFPDDRDFLVIEDTFYRPTSSVAGYFSSVSNRDQGFGVSLFDNSRELGSSGRLQGYVRTLFGLSAGLLNHELLHRWAAFLYDLGLSDSHWRAMLRPSSGFGEFWGAYHQFTALSNNTYRASFTAHSSMYNDLELYLMGLLPLDQVQSPIKYLINPQVLSFGSDPVTGVYYRDFRADGIGEVTMDQIVQRYGRRSPDSSDAQKQFSLGLIVLSDHLLSEVELGFFDMLAREYGQSSTAWPGMVTFAGSTGNRAQMNTMLPPLLQPVAEPVPRATLAKVGKELLLTWAGGQRPYVVQRAAGLQPGAWSDFVTNAEPPIVIVPAAAGEFYRIVSH